MREEDGCVCVEERDKGNGKDEMALKNSHLPLKKILGPFLDFSSVVDIEYRYEV